MREYLERIFPVISKEQNETATSRTWHLYDAMNFVEFCIFIMLRTILGTVFSIVFGLVKFGIVLLLTYAFAFSIFYYFDHYMPEENKETSTSKLKRPSEFGAWRETNSRQTSTSGLDSKWNDNGNETAMASKESNIVVEKEERRLYTPKLKRPSDFENWKKNSNSTHPGSASLALKLEEDNGNVTALDNKTSDFRDQLAVDSISTYPRSVSDGDEKRRLYPTIASLQSELTDYENTSTLKIEKSSFPPLPLDDETSLSAEQVVKVGSFRRSNAQSGRQSMVSRALADLENINTKTYPAENQTETVSITKSDVKAVKSSNV